MPSPALPPRLREIQDAIAIAILQIVRQADLGFVIDAVFVTPARDPGAAGCASPVAEMKSLLDDAPIRFCLNGKAQPCAARSQSCLAHGARHAVSPPPILPTFCLLSVTGLSRMS